VLRSTTINPKREILNHKQYQMLKIINILKISENLPNQWLKLPSTNVVLQIGLFMQNKANLPAFCWKLEILNPKYETQG
jgi:hypothetical protein